MKKIIPILLAAILFVGCLPSTYQECEEVIYSTPEPHAADLYVDGHYFKDTAGRVVLLRGVNATGDSKVPPFITLTDPSLLDPLPGWGINVIRFLFTWEAFEPDRCEYDETYLSYYEQAVQWAAERDIYVIVDFHQDAYSRFALGGCGEGFPAWAVSSFVGTVEPVNDESCVGWGSKMAIDINNKIIWYHFHTNRDGARTRYLDMLEAVAHRLSNHTNVIGYDIINEPWGQDSQLLALYEDAAEAIRKHHPEAILFVSPHALVSGIGSNTMNKPSFSNFAYSPHYYDVLIWLNNEWMGNSPSIRLNSLRQKALAWDVPMLLGEFGASATTLNGPGYLEAIYQWLDQHFISGAQWSYTPGWTPELKDGWNGENFSIVDDTGQLRSTFTPRPYPQKTAGIPIEFLRNDTSIQYTWHNDPTTGNTEIFLPIGFQNGKVSKVTMGTGSCTLQEQSMECSISSSGTAQVKLYIPE